MPRIPNREVEDDFDDYEDFNIEPDEPPDRTGRRVQRQDRDWEEQRREQWRKRHRDE